MQEPQKDKEYWLAEETLLVRHSGEIPEIAFHGALYYLVEDPEGPQLELLPTDIKFLEEQAVERYLEILQRDLQPANRDLPLYRGLERCAVNWQRLKQFFARRQRDGLDEIRWETGTRLKMFLCREMAEVQRGDRVPSVNCSAARLRVFLKELRVGEEELPPGWEELCPGGVRRKEKGERGKG